MDCSKEKDLYTTIEKAIERAQTLLTRAQEMLKTSQYGKVIILLETSETWCGVARSNALAIYDHNHVEQLESSQRK